MQRLIDVLSGYQPDYVKVVQGFTDEKIAAMESALGRSLPAHHRDFLATAAANLGFFVDQVSFDIDEVIELIEYKSSILPRHLVPLAVDDSPASTDYYLDLARSPMEGDGLVVSSPMGAAAYDDLEPEYPSLQDMLLWHGFRNVRMLLLPHRYSVSWGLDAFKSPQPPQRDELERILEHLGLSRLEISSEGRALYDGEDCAAMVRDSMKFPTFLVMFAATTKREAILLAETVCDTLPGDGVRREW